MHSRAKLIIDSSENNADLYYGTKFFVPDPVIFIEHGKEKILVLNDLEFDRGKRDSTADIVIPLTEYIKKLQSRKKEFDFVGILNLIFKERGIKEILVPSRFPVKFADGLRRKSFKVKFADRQLFYLDRIKKNDSELKNIKDAMRSTEKAMALAIDMVSSSKIKGNKLYLQGKLLNSELVKAEINSYLSRLGYVASHTIVSGGKHSSMPHHTGTGPLYANKPIIIDIFPRSQKTGYFGDLTRTVVKGEPSRELIKMYKTVHEGQKHAISLIKDGRRVKTVHMEVLKLFKDSGFENSMINGKPQGFIHSTGHGLGLEIHEPPRIGSGEEILKAGNVVTVEPGLYYERLGGIRIEDVVSVTKEGCKNLTRIKKKFVV